MITLSRFQHAAALAAGAVALTVTALAAAPAFAATSSAISAHPAVAPAHGIAPKPIKPIKPIKPMNQLPVGPSTLHVQAFGSDCARIDGQGALIVGTGDCTVFEVNAFLQLVEVVNNQPTNNCLFYNHDGLMGDMMPNTYDLLPCTTSGAAGAWESLSNNNYSETTDQFNASRGWCLWETGTGTSHPAMAKQCDGSSSGDRWQWQAS